MNASTSTGRTRRGGLRDHGEEDLQVIGHGQHRVRPAPPSQELQVLIQQPDTQPHHDAHRPRSATGSGGQQSQACRPPISIRTGLSACQDPYEDHPHIMHERTCLRTARTRPPGWLAPGRARRCWPAGQVSGQWRSILVTRRPRGCPEASAAASRGGRRGEPQVWDMRGTAARRRRRMDGIGAGQVRRSRACGNRKTVGSAYVGSNPTPATTVMSQDIEDTANLRKGRGVFFGQPDGRPVGW